MRRSARALRLLVLLALALVMMTPTAAGAQDTPATDAPPATLPSIIPRPGSGRAPENEGERGTLSQYGVMGLIVVGLGAIGLMIARESRAKLTAQKERDPGE